MPGRAAETDWRAPPDAAGSGDDGAPTLPRASIFSIIRAMRRDQLLLFPPEIYPVPLHQTRYLLLDSFFLNRPDLIEHVLLGNAGNYVKSVFLRRMLGPLVGNGLLTSEGEFWRRQRRTVAPAFHHRRIAGFVATMAATTEARIARWTEKPETFDLAPEMMALALEIIAHTMFAAEAASVAPEVARLLDIIRSHGAPSVFDLFGLPEWLPRHHPRAYNRAVADLDRLVMDLILPQADAAAACPGEAGGENLLAMLLAARDPESGEGMSPRQIRDEVMTIFLAGHETTAITLTWAWYLLSRNEGAAARLQAEVDEVLGGRRPAMEDLANLAYTRRVVEETMRLYPPAHTLSRTALAEDVLGGRPVPAGALITISPYVTHRNPTLWPDPERFDPDRFLPERVQARERFAYLPFGGGPRICIGNGFALTEAAVVLAMLAQRFHFRLAPGHRVRAVGRTTLRAEGGLWIRPEPRA